jgi:RNA polymerase sigma-70 factor (ECF subfamily)
MEDTPKSEWIVEALKLHERSLIRYASWILNDIECAREVVQETFLRLCKEDPAQVSGHLAQWLFTVCRNLAFDARRKETRMAPLGQMEIGVAPGLDEKQTVSEILLVVQTLPKNQREVIYLKFQCDLSYKEISDITKLSVTNVGFLIHTAVRNIRQQMLSETASQTSRNAHQAHQARRIQ